MNYVELKFLEVVKILIASFAFMVCVSRWCGCAETIKLAEFQKDIVVEKNKESFK